MKSDDKMKALGRLMRMQCVELPDVEPIGVHQATVLAEAAKVAFAVNQALLARDVGDDEDSDRVEIGSENGSTSGSEEEEEADDDEATETAGSSVGSPTPSLAKPVVAPARRRVTPPLAKVDKGKVVAAVAKVVDLPVEGKGKRKRKVVEVAGPRFLLF